MSLEPLRLCDEVGLVFCDKLTDAQCSFRLGGERLRTRDVGDVCELVWFDRLSSTTSTLRFPQYLRSFRVLKFVACTLF